MPIDNNHNGAARRRLSDILNGGCESLQSAWETTKAASEFAPLPGGIYVAHILSGVLDKAKTGTLGYKLTFIVIEGEHTGRRFWHDIWLTPAALPMAKRDLAKLGIHDLEQLEQPLPQRLRVEAKVVIRCDDDGNEHNRVKSFDVVGIDEPEPDAFAPDTNTTDASAQGNGQEGADDDSPT